MYPLRQLIPITKCNTLWRITNHFFRNIICFISKSLNELHKLAATTHRRRRSLHAHRVIQIQQFLVEKQPNRPRHDLQVLIVALLNQTVDEGYRQNLVLVRRRQKREISLHHSTDIARPRIRRPKRTKHGENRRHRFHKQKNQPRYRHFPHNLIIVNHRQDRHDRRYHRRFEQGVFYVDDRLAKCRDPRHRRFRDQRETIRLVRYARLHKHFAKNTIVDPRQKHFLENSQQFHCMLILALHDIRKIIAKNLAHLTATRQKRKVGTPPTHQRHQNQPELVHRERIYKPSHHRIDHASLRHRYTH